MQSKTSKTVKPPVVIDLQPGGLNFFEPEAVGRQTSLFDVPAVEAPKLSRAISCPKCKKKIRVLKTKGGFVIVDAQPTTGGGHYYLIRGRRQYIEQGEQGFKDHTDICSIVG